MATVPSPHTWVAGSDYTTAANLQTLTDASNYLLSPPRARAYVNAAQSHATSGSFLVVNLDGETYDTDSIHSTVTNTSRMTAVTSGLYAIGGSIGYAANAVGVRGVRIRKNAAGLDSGGTAIDQSALISTASAGGTIVSFYFEYYLAAGDYIEMFGYQTSTAALAYLTGDFETKLMMRWVATS